MPMTVRWPYTPRCEMPATWRLTSKLVMSVIGTASYVWSRWANHTIVYNREALYHAVENRSPAQPLLTVCNHHSCLDEPVLWGMLRWRHLTYQNELMRWTLGAADVCFTREYNSKFFAYGRTIPVIRGEGVYQRAMDFCLERMNNGAWVHAYPEGRVNAQHKFIRLKWGVGRLIAECDVDPIVLPFYHFGMDDLLPNKTPYIPRTGKKITIVIGKPMNFSDIRRKVMDGTVSLRSARKLVTDQIQQEFEVLKQETKILHLKRI